MDAADPVRRQLGEVLLEAGLLGERDLAVTLAEQQRSGRRLGEILVARGLVSGAAVGNALAEQHGRFLRTEYGFATGLGGLIGSRVASEPAAPRKMSSSEQRRAADLEVQTLPQPDPNHLLFVQIEISVEAVDPGKRQLGEVLLEAAATAGGSADQRSNEAEPAEARGLAQPLYGTEALNEPAGIRKMSSSEQRRTYDPEVQTLPQPDPIHLLFVPTPGGYLLLRRIGEAPAPGQHLELPEAPNAQLYVSKIARSPLPLDERICAYLQTL